MKSTKVRLGNSQRFIARDLTDVPHVPLRYGTWGESEKIYDRLVETEVAEKIINPVSASVYPFLYKRGQRWIEAALKYGWVTETKQSA